MRPLSRPATLLSLLVAVPPPSAAGQQTPATIAVTRTLLIDGNRHEFTDVSWVGSSARGEVAVAFFREHHVEVFSRSGQPLATLGRGGAGPGEFRTVIPLGWTGDHLLVSDRMARRITTFGPDWKLVDTSPWPDVRFSPELASRFPGSPRLFNVAAHLDGNRGLLATVLVMPSDSAGNRGNAAPRALMVRLSGTGQVERFIAEIPGASCWGSPRPGGARFCPTIQHATSHEGHGYVVAGPVSDWPSRRVAQVSRVAITGDTVFTVAIPVPLVPVPQSVRDSVARLPVPPGLGVRPTTANEYPPVRSVHYGRDGRIWIAVSSPDPARGLLYALSPEGRLLGRVETAAGFRLHQADERELLGVERDADDVPSVVGYRFR